MFVVVKQECLDNPELVRRVKVFEAMGDSIVLLSSGCLDDAYEAMDRVNCDWDVLHEQEPHGYDILVGTDSMVFGESKWQMTA